MIRLAGILQKTLEPVSRREHKHPRIQAGTDFLVHAAGFEFHIGVDIHVPYQHTTKKRVMVCFLR